MLKNVTFIDSFQKIYIYFIIVVNEQNVAVN